MKNKLPILLLTVIVIFVFWQLQFVFYQQDEWRALGEFFALNNFTEIFNRFSLLKIILADGRFFSAIIGYWLMAKFPFNTYPLFIYTLGFHLINTILVFYLTKKFVKDNFLSFLSALFFGVSSISVGAVTWYGTSIGTLPATTLIILSIFYLLKAFDENSRSNYLKCFILLYLSQYFKETGYFFFIVFPILTLLYKKTNFKTFIFNFWYYFLAFFIIALFRFSQLASYTEHTAVFTSNHANNFLLVILIRAILYPLTSFFLVYIPSEFFLRIAKVFANAYYPFLPEPQAALLIQSVVGDLIAIIGSVLFLAALYLISAKKDFEKVSFLVLLALATYLPYIILSKDYTYLDSRYYYLGAIPAGILLSFFVLKIRERFGKILFLFATLLFSLYLLTNLFITRGQIIQLADVSQERLSILNQLSKYMFNLDEKNIFYITGDKNFYLSQGNNLPFQQGTGYTLLTWYSKKDDRFNEFLREGIFWDLGSQGYIEKGKYGFGYFWNKDLLEKTIKQNNFPKNKVKYFYYDSGSQILTALDPKKTK